ncbi:MAG: fasciclin domain-containing protein [Bacteroidales bacterium]|jgi:uncharacterized surface protein with fasciclin (FAS1) repeats|nr:fasciclin domain-containing protein [Bacteroidales bacterium]
MKKRYIIPIIRGFVILSAAALILVSCIQDSFDYQSSTTSETGKFNGTALDFINSAKPYDSLSLVREAIVITGLQSLYSQAGPRTFILPRNPGFRAYMTTNKYASLSAIPVATLTELLKYHIVKAYYHTADPQFIKSDTPISYQTEGSNPIFLSHNGNFQVVINQGTKKSFVVYVSNIRPTNGVIHVSSDVVTYQP